MTFLPLNCVITYALLCNPGVLSRTISNYLETSHLVLLLDRSLFLFQLPVQLNYSRSPPLPWPPHRPLPRGMYDVDSTLRVAVVNVYVADSAHGQCPSDISDICVYWTYRRYRYHWTTSATTYHFSFPPTPRPISSKRASPIGAILIAYYATSIVVYNRKTTPINSP